MENQSDNPYLTAVMLPELLLLSKRLFICSVQISFNKRVCFFLDHFFARYACINHRITE